MQAVSPCLTCFKKISNKYDKIYSSTEVPRHYTDGFYRTKCLPTVMNFMTFEFVANHLYALIGEHCEKEVPFGPFLSLMVHRTKAEF